VTNRRSLQAQPKAPSLLQCNACPLSKVIVAPRRRLSCPIFQRTSFRNSSIILSTFHVMLTPWALHHLRNFAFLSFDRRMCTTSVISSV
jgi:hypothetical protein